MKTIQLVDNFSIDNLEIAEQPQPQLTEEQVLVKV